MDTSNFQIFALLRNIVARKGKIGRGRRSNKAKEGRSKQHAEAPAIGGAAPPLAASSSSGRRWAEQPIAMNGQRWKRDSGYGFGRFNGRWGQVRRRWSIWRRRDQQWWHWRPGGGGSDGAEPPTPPELEGTTEATEKHSRAWRRRGGMHGEKEGDTRRLGSYWSSVMMIVILIIIMWSIFELWWMDAQLHMSFIQCLTNWDSMAQSKVYKGFLYIF